MENGEVKRGQILKLKCQTLQVNQKPEVAILHNNLYHVNSDGIKINNLRCWSVRYFYKFWKHISLILNMKLIRILFWKTQTTHESSIKYKLGFRMTLNIIIFFKSTWLNIYCLLFFVFRVLELDFFVWEILTGHFEESLWILFLGPNAMHCDTRRIH